MPVNNEVLALILGGGQGTRLFPLTQLRSKPAVPIGGKYRLIDIPISNCLHADIRRIFVLTQFNSASLNRHIAQTYRMDLFSQGFVEILAAEQTPDNPNWFQGTADAVRQARAPLRAVRRRLLPDSRRRSSLPHGLLRADRRAHRPQGRHHDRGAAGHGRRRDGDGHLPLRPHRPDRRVRGEAERRAAAGDRPEHSRRRDVRRRMRRTSRSSRRWASTCSRATCCSTCSSSDGAKDFGREIIPAALGRYRVNAHLFRGYWADVGTVESFYDANIMLTQPGAPFKFYDPHRPIYTHPRFLPGSRLSDCSVRDVDHRGRLLPRSLHDRGARSSASARTSRPAPTIRALGAARRRLLRGRRRCAGARGRPAARHRPQRRARSRHRRQERAHRRRRAARERERASSTPTATATTSATASSSSRRTASSLRV